MSTLFKTKEELQQNRHERLVKIAGQKDSGAGDSSPDIETQFSAQNKQVRSEVNDSNFSISTDLQSNMRNSLDNGSELDATTKFLNEAYKAQSEGKAVDQNYLSALEKNILTATDGTQYYSKTTGQLESMTTLHFNDQAVAEQKSALVNYQYIKDGSFTQRIKKEASSRNIESYMTSEQIDAYNNLRNNMAANGNIDEEGLLRVKADFYVDALQRNNQFDEFKASFNENFVQTGKASLETQIHVALKDSYSESGWQQNNTEGAVGVPTMDTFVVLDSQINTAGIGIDPTQWMGYGTIGSASLGYDYSIVQSYGELLNGGQLMLEVSLFDQKYALFNTDFPEILLTEAWQGALKNDTSNWNITAKVLAGLVNNLTLAPESGEVPTIHIPDDGSNALANNADYIQSMVNKALGSIGGTVMDPLIIDLDGDGIETVSADGSVMFDHNVDGVKRGTGWAGADDGLLVRDIDGNGTIDNGRELFGDNTLKSDGTIATDGFDALADLDSNADGVFNSLDTAFDEVKVWQDANSDGISQAGELQTLSEAGISDINLNGVASNIATDGGIISKTGTVTNTDGTTANIGNLDFNQNAIYREYINKLDTSNINGNIDLDGLGYVRSLKESATLDSSIASAIQSFESNISYGEKLNLADDTLLSWARTSGSFTSKLDELENLSFDDGTQISFKQGDWLRGVFDKTITLETFSAERLFNYDLVDNGNSYTLSMSVGTGDINTHGAKAEYTFSKGSTLTLDGNSFTFTNPHYKAIESGYNQIKDSLMQEVFFKTEYPQILENLSFEYDTDSGAINLDLSGIKDYLYSKMADDFNSGKELFKAFGDYTGESFTSNGFNFDLDAFMREAPTSIINQINANNADNIIVSNSTSQNGTNSNDTIYASNANSIIDGKSGNDLLIGGNGDDIIRGGAGRDHLKGGDGNDTLSSGNYNSYELLEGGKGNDTLISDYGSYGDGYKYNLGDGLDIIKRASTSYSSTNTFNHKIQFGEGITQDDLSFFKDGNNLFVQVGNDSNSGLIIENYYNNDYRYKSMVSHIEFDDWSRLDFDDADIGQIYHGSDNNDIITSLNEDDVLQGKDGSDTYKYSQGDGNDIIQQTSSDGTSTDTLELTGIDYDDILFSRDGDDLNISFDNNILGSIEIDDYFTEQFNNNDALIIDANDEFQMQLSANSAKIREILAGITDDVDLDGGSVDGTNQVNTKIGSSELSELWVPKEDTF